MYCRSYWLPLLITFFSVNISLYSKATHLTGYYTSESVEKENQPKNNSQRNLKNGLTCIVMRISAFANGKVFVLENHPNSPMRAEGSYTTYG